MRNVSSKIKTLRRAVASGRIELGAQGLDAVRKRESLKGDPLAAARIAGIQAAKQTALLIPFCHPLPLDHVEVEFAVEDASVVIRAEATAIARTGVEMEALSAVSGAALTIYDMLKYLNEEMIIGEIRLLEKSGGKSDFISRANGRKAAVLVSSDSVAAGQAEDRSGKHIVSRLEESGYAVVDYRIVPDEMDEIERWLVDFADRQKVDLVLTTGGTGLGPRDLTGEGTIEVLDRETPGIVEAVRAYGVERTPQAKFSQGRAGVRGRTLIVNLPGSVRAVEESLDCLLPGLPHAFAMLAGEGHDKRGRSGDE